MADVRRRSYAVKVSADGSFIVPAQVRRDLGWSPGKDLWLEVGESEILLTTPERAMERARRQAGNLFDSDEAGVDALIAERRRAAADEDDNDSRRGDIAA